MSKNKKGRRWDGRSRVSNDNYRKRFNEIFKKKEKTLSEELMEGFEKEQKDLEEESEERLTVKKNIQTEIVNGTCPTCSIETVLVSIWPNLFRCMTCGTDLEQKVNGKISYIPNTKNVELRMKIDG
tara:strand:- start:684 stop:1061 length:378 start_codon:yes stop_codon:yes gene_type:complete